MIQAVNNVNNTANGFIVYPDYKSSGVAWLGDIPSHWEVKKCKYIFEFSGGLNITKANLIDKGIPCVNYGEVHSKYGFEVDPALHELKCVSNDYLNTHPNAVIKKGDFVFADTSEDYEGSGNFTHLNSDIVTFAGYHTVVARQNIHNHRFLAYVFDSQKFRNQIQNSVSGVKVFSITQAILKNSFIWFPDHQEQQAIVNFLDEKTDHIDRLIDKQQQLINKLAEQRTAIISHAVTKGLNPNSPMKNSGVEWLGDIPEHWEVKRLKYLVSCNDDVLSEKTDADYEINYIDISSVSLTEGVKHKEHLLFHKSPSRARRIVIKGDVIISTVRTYLKAIAQIEEESDNLIVSTGFAVLRSKENLFDKFLGYWVQSEIIISKIMANSNGVSYPAINATDIVKLPIVSLPLNEQQAIVNYLDEKTANIDKMTQATKSTIDKLKEYRSALITQAVTGKIDVRHLANTNPNQHK
ncbi:restriction endonuclease subunit S [Acinetobacter sp. c1-l78]|uniref:restriction endonuclease subunit S n=1 Tax=Acinetobacter sp. c1-l78 TaxID=3342803 RepID=UPI0035B99C12